MNSLFAVALILAATHNDPHYKKAPWIEIDGMTQEAVTYSNTLPWEPTGVTFTFRHLPKGTVLSCFIVGEHNNVLACDWEKPTKER